MKCFNFCSFVLFCHEIHLNLNGAKKSKTMIKKERLKVPSEHLGKLQHFYCCVSKLCPQSVLHFLSVWLSLSLFPLLVVAPLGLSQPLLSLINWSVRGDGGPPEEQRASRPGSSVKNRKKKAMTVSVDTRRSIYDPLRLHH